MAYRPQLTHAARPATYTVEARDETGALVPTPIAGEHPLTLYVDKREILTMMTLGAAPEALAIGFLRNQRLVKSIEEIVSVQVDWEVNAVAVTTRNGLADLENEDREAHRDHGLRPGHGVRRPDGRHRVDPPATTTCASRRRRSSACSTRCACTSRSTSRRARCTAARSRKGAEILTFVEDVGRHNAVDAIAGWMWLEGVDGGDKIFYTTGRLTSEMVIKAAQMGRSRSWSRARGSPRWATRSRRRSASR